MTLAVTAAGLSLGIWIYLILPRGGGAWKGRLQAEALEGRRFGG